MKFLIDECLSPELVGLARARSFHESMHVTWLGMRSKTDWAIVRRAVRDGFVLVTNNTTDFTVLYEREEIHAGLVCLNVAPGFMRLEVQKSLFLLALNRMGKAEPVNELIEVTLTETEEVVFARYALPSNFHGSSFDSACVSYWRDVWASMEGVHVLLARADAVLQRRAGNQQIPCWNQSDSGGTLALGIRALQGWANEEPPNDPTARPEIARRIHAIVQPLLDAAAWPRLPRRPRIRNG